MSEDLTKENKEEVMCFKVSLGKRKELRKFVQKRGWNMSAFIRVALDESMEKIIKEKSFTDEASGD